MKGLRLILQIGLLDLFYYAGVYIQKLTHLPIPGSVIGLVLLFTMLKCKVIPVSWIETGTTFIQRYLPLFFIPATVGVMNNFHVFASGGQWLLLILIVSTLITMATAGHVSQWLTGHSSARKERPVCSSTLPQ